MRCCERGKAAYMPATRCIAGASNKAIGKVGWSIFTIFFPVHFFFNFFFCLCFFFFFFFFPPGAPLPPPPLVSRHGSDVVGCAQPSERSARRIACPYRAVLASDATP